MVRFQQLSDALRRCHITSTASQHLVMTRCIDSVSDQDPEIYIYMTLFKHIWTCLNSFCRGMVIPDCWANNTIPYSLTNRWWEVFSGGWLGVSSGTRGLGCLPEIGYFVPSSFRQSQAIFTLALRRWQLSRRYIMYTSVDFGIHRQWHPMTHDHNGESHNMNTTTWWLGLNLCGGEL